MAPTNVRIWDPRPLGLLEILPLAHVRRAQLASLWSLGLWAWGQNAWSKDVVASQPELPFFGMLWEPEELPILRCQILRIAIVSHLGGCQNSGPLNTW